MEYLFLLGVSGVPGQAQGAMNRATPVCLPVAQKREPDKGMPGHICTMPGQ